VTKNPELRVSLRMRESVKLRLDSRKNKRNNKLQVLTSGVVLALAQLPVLPPSEVPKLVLPLLRLDLGAVKLHYLPPHLLVMPHLPVTRT